MHPDLAAALVDAKRTELLRRPRHPVPARPRQRGRRATAGLAVLVAYAVARRNERYDV